MKDMTHIQDKKILLMLGNYKMSAKEVVHELGLSGVVINSQRVYDAVRRSGRRKKLRISSFGRRKADMEGQ